MLDVLSGEKRGIVATSARGLLWWGQWPYIMVVNHRNRRFDRGHRVHSVDRPVISIGNLTTGGTGKTPAVAWLCRRLRDRQQRVAILSRGYGAEAGSVNDEALELEQQLPDVPHLQDPERVKIAEIAIEELETEVLVLDDGFQHRRLGRDLDWVLVDALNPFGYGHCLPRGLLREPLQSFARADAILMTRSDQVSESALHDIVATISKFKDAAVPLVRTRHQPMGWRDVNGNEFELSRWQGKSVAGFCAIGNPKGFESTLNELGCNIAGWKVFQDHHRFQREDIESLEALVSSSPEVEAVVCTVKDLVKLNVATLAGKPLVALQIGLDFIDDPAPLEQQIDKLLQSQQDSDRDA